MTLAIRTAIATAATVDGVTQVQPRYTQSTNPGHGSVRLDDRIRDGAGIGFVDVWQVVIFLPQAIAAAEEWLDDNLDTVLDAVSSELTVLSATPASVALASGTAPGVIISGVRAHQ